MPWGGGTFTRFNGVFSGSLVWTNDKDAGTKITSAHHDTHDQDLAQGINACLNKNGQNSPTANIPWGGYKITGLSYGSADKDSATYGQTITAASINPATKVLTLTRTQGNVTVDLTPIVVAGDTSDFARQSLANTFTDTNDFNSAVNFAGPAGGQTRWVFGGVAILNAYADTSGSWVAYDNASVVPALRIDTAAQTLSVYGNTLWTSANLTPSDYLNASGSYTITGSWAFNGGVSFGGLSIQTPPIVVIAGSGYSWTASVPSATQLQFASTNGSNLVVQTDATRSTGTKLRIGNTAYAWNTESMQVLVGAAPTGGQNGDVAFVVTSADQGVWVKNAGSWVKIAS